MWPCRRSRRTWLQSANLQWVVTAYALTFGGLLLLGGRLADLFGRRRILLLGLVLFTGASLIGGFAQNQGTLIAARSLQGVGAAVLSPATLTILTVTFTEQRARARALGVWSAVAAGGGAAGALFGGFLTQYLSWRWILFVNVPIGIVLFLVARLSLRESKAEGPRQHLDLAGSITVTAGLLALVYTIVHTDEVSWTSASTLITGAIAVVLLQPLRPHRGPAGRAPPGPAAPVPVAALTFANLVMFSFGIAMFAMWFFLSLYLRQVLGYDPVITGLTFVPQTAAIAVGATIAGRLAPRFGPRNVLVVGAVLAAGGLYWLSFVRATDTYWTTACGGGVLATFGVGLALTPVALAATGARPPGGGRTGLGPGQQQPSDRRLGGAGRAVHRGRLPHRLPAGRAGGHPGGRTHRHDRRLRPRLPHRLDGGAGRGCAGPVHRRAGASGPGRGHRGGPGRHPGRGLAHGAGGRYLTRRAT